MLEGFEHLTEYSKNPRIYWTAGIIGMVAAGVFFFTEYVAAALLVAGVALTAWTVNQLGIKTVGIELTTLSTVLIGAVYGPFIGAVAGFGLILLQVIAGQYTGGYIIWVIPSYAVAGFAAGFFSGRDIFVLGAALTVGMQVVFALLSSVTSLGSLDRYLPYAVTNTGFNLVLFYYFAPLMLELMV